MNIINYEKTHLLKAKILDYEKEIIRNHKTLEENKSEIELLQIKNVEKIKVINSFENRIDELNIINKNYEDQISSQSKKIISYLVKIQKLQDSVRTLEASLKEATKNVSPSILNHVLKVLNKASKI